MCPCGEKRDYQSSAGLHRVLLHLVTVKIWRWQTKTKGFIMVLFSLWTLCFSSVLVQMNEFFDTVFFFCSLVCAAMLPVLMKQNGCLFTWYRVLKQCSVSKLEIKCSFIVFFKMCSQNEVLFCSDNCEDPHSKYFKRRTYEIPLQLLLSQSFPEEMGKKF